MFETAVCTVHNPIIHHAGIIAKVIGILLEKTNNFHLQPINELLSLLLRVPFYVFLLIGIAIQRMAMEFNRTFINSQQLRDGMNVNGNHRNKNQILHSFGTWNMEHACCIDFFYHLICVVR